MSLMTIGKEASSGAGEPVPAATVVLVREGVRGTGQASAVAKSPLRVLLLRRNARLVFHGGHWVFPGGRLDRCDYRDDDGGLEYPAALRAAVRETREEAGIAIDPRRLIHTAHWTTPPRLPRRFATWFFLCPLPEAPQVRVDQEEIIEYRWIEPAAALAEAAAGRLQLPRPTAATLADIKDFTSLATLARAAREREVLVFPPGSPHFRPGEMGCVRKTRSATAWTS